MRVPEVDSVRNQQGINIAGTAKNDTVWHAMKSHSTETDTQTSILKCLQSG